MTLYSRSRAEWLESREEAKKARLAALLTKPAVPARGVYGNAGVFAPLPKADKPVRDESYRRWVASLPCFECGIEGFSQAAHPNSGKAKGKKLSDAACFPMCCDRPGVVGCHSLFDQYRLVLREEMPQYEAQALEWTRKQGEGTTNVRWVTPEELRAMAGPPEGETA